MTPTSLACGARPAGRSALVAAACLVLSCSDPDMFTGTRAKEAAGALSARIGPSRNVLDVSVSARSIHVLAVEPNEGWQYGARGVVGPLPVGVDDPAAGAVPSDADARLRFAFASVDFAVVPSLVQQVQQRTGKVPSELRLYKRDAFIDAKAPPVWLIVVPDGSPLVAAANGTLEP